MGMKTLYMKFIFPKHCHKLQTSIFHVKTCVQCTCAIHVYERGFSFPHLKCKLLKQDCGLVEKMFGKVKTQVFFCCIILI